MYRSPIRFVVACAAVLAFAVGASASDKEDMEAIAGLWELTGMTRSGFEVPTEQLPTITFEFKADGTAIGELPEGRVEATAEIDSEAEPKTIDVTHTGGAFKDQTQYGIYEIDGDTVRFSMTDPGGDPEDRPKDFSVGVVLTFSRAG